MALKDYERALGGVREPVQIAADLCRGLRDDTDPTVEIREINEMLDGLFRAEMAMHKAVYSVAGLSGAEITALLGTIKGTPSTIAAWQTLFNALKTIRPQLRSALSTWVSAKIGTVDLQTQSVTADLKPIVVGGTTYTSVDNDFLTMSIALDDAQTARSAAPLANMIAALEAFGATPAP